MRRRVRHFEESGLWRPLLHLFIQQLPVDYLLFPVIGGLCSLFVGLPVAYGFTIVMLGVCKEAKTLILVFCSKASRIMDVFFVTMLLQAVYTILWSLLLVIPGIIKSYSYAMTSFILKDEPEMKKQCSY